MTRRPSSYLLLGALLAVVFAGSSAAASGSSVAASPAAVPAAASGPSSSAAAGGSSAAGEVATATVTAMRAGAVADMVSVSASSRLPPPVVDAALRAAAAAGGVALPGGASQIGLLAVRRGGVALQQAPAGYRYPVGLTVLPVEAAMAAMGPAVSGVLALGRVVLSETGASLRNGVAPGDTLDVVGRGGEVVNLVVGAIVPDAGVGGAELVARQEEADLLGAGATTRVLIWGMRSRAEIDRSLAANGLIAPVARVERSWDPLRPDATIGLARTKALLGEFAFRPAAGDAIVIEPGWSATHVHPQMRFASIGIRAQCHNEIVPAIQGALDEIAANGLAGYVELGPTNTMGGCFNPRMNRITANLGFVSRHSWAMALDMNVTSNPQGRPPRMNCEIVRIFRKWGFAWGGNFPTPDGMHFEYVGEPRDQRQHPVAYCPNPGALVAGDQPAEGPTTAGETGARATMFASDGF